VFFNVGEAKKNQQKGCFRWFLTISGDTG